MRELHAAKNGAISAYRNERRSGGQRLRRKDTLFFPLFWIQYQNLTKWAYFIAKTMEISIEMSLRVIVSVNKNGPAIAIVLIIVYLALEHEVENEKNLNYFLFTCVKRSFSLSIFALPTQVKWGENTICAHMHTSLTDHSISFIAPKQVIIAPSICCQKTIVTARSWESTLP